MQIGRQSEAFRDHALVDDLEAPQGEYPSCPLGEIWSITLLIANAGLCTALGGALSIPALTPPLEQADGLSIAGCADRPRRKLRGS